MLGIIKPLILKDITRFKVLLITWAFILCLKAFVEVNTEIFLQFGMSKQVLGIISIYILYFLDYALIFVLIPFLIQEESCVGTTAFWLTRPISRQDLLLTKGVLIISVFVLFPTLVDAITIACGNFSGKYVLLAIPESFLERFCMIMPIVLTAACTRKFSEYAKYIFITVAICLLTGIIIAFLNKSGGLDIKTTQTITGHYSQEIVVSLLGGIIAACFIVYQYLSRRGIIVLWLAFILYGMTIALAMNWQMDFMKISQTTDIASIKDGVNVSIDPAHISIIDGKHKKDATKVIRSRTLISTLPSSIMVDGWPDSSLQMWYADGVKLTSLSGRLKPSSGWASVVKGAFPDIDVKNPWEQRFKYETIFELRANDFEQYKGQVGTYAVDMNFKAYQYDLIGRVPLKVGAKNVINNHAVKIRDMLTSISELKVTIVSRQLYSMFERKPEQHMAELSWDALHVLLNKRTGQAIVAYSDRSKVTSWLRQQNFAAVARELTFPFKESGVNLTQEWLNDAELIIFRPRTVAEFKKEIRLKGFALPVATTDPDPLSHEKEDDTYFEEFEVGKDYYAQSALPAGMKDEETIKAYREEYLRRRYHKVFTMSSSSNFGYCTRKDTIEEAKECAIERCNKYRKSNDKCVVVDINGKIEKE